MKTMHDTIKTHFASMKRVQKIADVIELPNRYGANTSNFSMKYDYHYDGRTETSNIMNFNIDWDRKVLFISNCGYRPFTSVEDIINLIEETMN
jgi:hypothetical protein